VEALQLWVRWPVDDDRLSREVRRDGEVAAILAGNA
jgi:hypothetical protein